MLRPQRATGFALAIAMIGACASKKPPRAASSPALHDESSVDGAEVFESTCSTCHGPTGHPTEAMVARLGVRDLTAPEFRARVTVELVENQVRKGSTNKVMPSFEGALTPEQISAVAMFVAGPGFVKP